MRFVLFAAVYLCKVLLEMLRRAAAFFALNTNLSTAVIEQTTTRLLNTECDLFVRPETGQVPVIASHDVEEEPLVP